MNGIITIAVDAMGGDHGLNVVLPACLQLLKDVPDVKVVAVGQQEVINTAIAKFGEHQRLSVHHASEIVAMDEPPATALRNKKDSSMRVACNLLKEGEVQACVSAGNTGALMAIARYVLKTIPGISRPAILFPLPSTRGVVHMLDLGANVDCTAEHLFQFAVMGSELVRSLYAKDSPSIGLLNIGSEIIKGTESVKNCAKMLLQAKDLNFAGFVEGDDIYKGNFDVVVCDGFAGNVALKASEGTAQMIIRYMQETLAKNWYRRFLGLLLAPSLRAMYAQFDKNQYNGASLLGLQGVVIKSHGNAGLVAYTTALKRAVNEVRQNVPAMIKQSVAAKLGNVVLA